MEADQSHYVRVRKIEGKVNRDAYPANSAVNAKASISVIYEQCGIFERSIESHPLHGYDVHSSKSGQYNVLATQEIRNLPQNHLAVHHPALPLPPLLVAWEGRPVLAYTTRTLPRRNHVPIAEHTEHRRYGPLIVPALRGRRHHTGARASTIGPEPTLLDVAYVRGSDWTRRRGRGLE